MANITYADFDTYINMQLAPNLRDDDLGRGHTSLTRSANVHIEFTDTEVIVHGLGLYPMPIERSRVGRVEAWING